MRAMLVGALLAALGLVAPGAGHAEPASGPNGRLAVAATAVAAAPVQFVAQAAASRNVATPWIVLPASVQAGDRVVLVLSLASTSRQVSAPTGVTGWSQAGNLAAGTSMRTVLWSKDAAAGDAGKRVNIPLNGSVKTTVQVAAYRGVDPTAPTVVSKAEVNTRTVRTTPTAVAPAGAWVLSYWAGKSASATSWSLPASVTPGGTAANTGSGHITSALADSGSAVPAGNYGNLAATSNASTGSATTWTVVLAPRSRRVQRAAGGRLHAHLRRPRLLVRRHDVLGRSGEIASYDWTSATMRATPGSPSSTATTDAGTYEVELTVTDADGATGSITHSVRRRIPTP